ncbi:MAG: hypothetical protein Q9222_005722 [Ikaeria aurantiellina]
MSQETPPTETPPFTETEKPVTIEKQEPSRSVTVPADEPINDTWWRRHLTLLALKIPRFLKKHPREDYLRLPHKKLWIRRARAGDFSEAQTIQFIARHTSIPVPKIYCCFKRKGDIWLVMEWIKGRDVAQGWRQRSEQSKDRILDQLRHMITEMRQVPHPEHLGVASVTGGALNDGRVPGSSDIFGPFKTVADFHSYVRGGIDDAPQMPEIQQIITKHNEPWPICFTHGDLSSFNIVVRGDDVVGIIDWETAGWYPSYWEYTNAWHVNPFNTFWQDEIDKFLEPIPEGLDLDRLRRKYFDMFGTEASYSSFADA